MQSSYCRAAKEPRSAIRAQNERTKRLYRPRRPCPRRSLEDEPITGRSSSRPPEPLLHQLIMCSPEGGQGTGSRVRGLYRESVQRQA
ncbi:hypothetical protein MHYP_G00185890 [Metynnis hypsauchen]